MRCVNCGEVIAGEPAWVEGEPYCSHECAEEMFFDEEESEESFEGDYEAER